MPGDPRRALIDLVEQRVGAIVDPYRSALLEVDRADFVRREDIARAWIDEPLPLDTPHGKGVATVSAPHMYVLGFDALGLRKGDRLLELGSGSGYGAALASYVVGHDGLVTTVETDPHLARIALRTTARLPNVKVIHDDGLRRGDLLATHPKCWLTFSVNEMPVALLDQLVEGSVIVAPVGPTHDQRLLRYSRHDGAVRIEDLGAVRFVGARPLIED
jgi:protein-L-isoaspartate(D-aspartate) O-methyltransferase